ncbi:hypothetical protein [Devosia sp.]|uniref:hypothetical protein n=1 Tax=Devosia sp. TaxID=1871048 RepID=UPI002931444A|nr:hypothetical protein [Devosia sp.]
MERLLVHRTRDAIQTRSQTLGLGRYKPWRPDEKEVFRKVAALHSDSEIAAMLGRTATSVEAYRLKHSKVRRHGKKAPIVPVINDVYDLATRRGVVISKLASALGCGRIKRGDARHRMSITAVATIVEVLGGELYAEWSD